MYKSHQKSAPVKLASVPLTAYRKTVKHPSFLYQDVRCTSYQRKREINSTNAMRVWSQQGALFIWRAGNGAVMGNNASRWSARSARLIQWSMKWVCVFDNVQSIGSNNSYIGWAHSSGAGLNENKDLRAVLRLDDRESPTYKWRTQNDIDISREGWVWKINVCL